VGECRGGEALDMLQAMNTGHDGSLTTLHANTPNDALSRLETLALMSGLDLPSRAIRDEGGRFAFWDALILATAGQAGCAVVLSEDMADGARFDGVTVLDPFEGSDLPAPVAALLGLGG
jgi:pilus assembly protein CpaF